MRPDSENTSLERLIDGLSVPAAFPHAVREVEVVQTHISCVFLTGEFAYKIKKPVDFGFLDFRFLDQRHLFCKQEVLLNARLCPDLYLDVVPITTDASGLHIDGDGVPIEWAVRMRQLNPEEMLSVRLAQGKISVDVIGIIADLLADFHARSLSTPEI